MQAWLQQSAEGTRGKGWAEHTKTHRCVRSSLHPYTAHFEHERGAGASQHMIVLPIQPCQGTCSAVSRRSSPARMVRISFLACVCSVCRSAILPALQLSLLEDAAAESAAAARCRQWRLFLLLGR